MDRTRYGWDRDGRFLHYAACADAGRSLVCHTAPQVRHIDKQNSRLEIVFTQHPARFVGTVTDTEGRSVPHGWVVVFGADRPLWRDWSTLSRAVQTDEKGAFRFTMPAGEYLVRGFPPTAFSSDRAALSDLERVAEGATPVQLDEREQKALKLTIDEP